MVPKDREGEFQTELLERYQRSEKASLTQRAVLPAPGSALLMETSQEWRGRLYLRMEEDTADPIPAQAD